MFDWLRNKKTNISKQKVVYQNFKGTAYCAIIQEEWFSDILVGKIGELKPWKIPEGLVYPVFALDEIITKKEEYFKQAVISQKRNLFGIRLNKFILEKMKCGEVKIIESDPPYHSIQTVLVMTPKTLATADILLNFCISDGKRIFNYKPNSERNLILAYDSFEGSILFKDES